MTAQTHVPKNANTRGVAAQIIGRWLRTDLFPDRLIAQGTTDRAFVMEVVYGVVKRRRMLEWVVDHYAARRPDANVLPYLLVGLYQVFLMDSVVDYAAVNETVEALKSGSAGKAVGFVNGILRRSIRERDALLAELSRQDFAVTESHPDDLATRWKRVFGKEKAEALCRWNNERATVIVAPNPLKTSFTAFQKTLAEAGIDAVPHTHAPEEFLMLPGGTRVASLPGYLDGLFSVQDPSTREAVRLLDPQPGDVVLDACAAPGGKTMLAAERMQDRGSLVAMDMYRDRLNVLEQNVARMGLTCVQLREGNAASEADVRNAWDTPTFDRILLDVPCSNTGVLQRRPDARWRFTEERVSQLKKIQRILLDNTAQFLKPGGRLVYSTCSLEPEENQLLVTHWLDEHADFECVDSISLFPPESRTDGVYAAALVKSRNPNPA